MRRLVLASTPTGPSFKARIGAVAKLEPCKAFSSLIGGRHLKLSSFK